MSIRRRLIFSLIIGVALTLASAWMEAIAWGLGVPLSRFVVLNRERDDTVYVRRGPTGPDPSRLGWSMDRKVGRYSESATLSNWGWASEIGGTTQPERDRFVRYAQPLADPQLTRAAIDAPTDQTPPGVFGEFTSIESSGGQGASITWRALGWPRLALCSRERFCYRMSDGNATVNRVVSGGITLIPAQVRVSTPTTGGRGTWTAFSNSLLMPLRPVFPDILIDIAFYAALAFPLLSIGALRRIRRAKRGRCRHCAYDRRGLPPSTPCPECGQVAITPAANEPSAQAEGAPGVSNPPAA